MPPSSGRILAVFLAFLLGLTLTTSAGEVAATTDLGVKVPDGFEVVEFAGDDLAHDIYAMTLDSQGRIVVAGAGYVKILIDKDQDGMADEAKLFSDVPRNGAQGMFFHGRSLICVGDEGVIRLRDNDGDDRADGPPDLFLRSKTGGEHDLHSIQRGPDGWWYLIAGNNSGINERYAKLPTSPITQPRAGVVLRLKPDLSSAEILANGLRNAYDFAFNAQGDMFTYDSDEEREVTLPWYRPTRVFQVLPACDHGWVSKSWMRPDDAFDMPPVLASFGRGSPTGVTCYRHTQFPEKYRGALFTLDWTYGRVHALPLKPAAETGTTEPELFMSSVGQHGFAPTDIEVGPDGSVYVSVGGRGSRGGVYRIRYTAVGRGSPDPASPDPAPAKARDPSSATATATGDDKLAQVLEAPQPLSSWSRARWIPIARELGAAPIQEAALDEKRSVSSRIRAIEVLTELFQGIDAATLRTLAASQSPNVRARAVWSYGRSPSEQLDTDLLKIYLDDPNPLVGRYALETCLTVAPQAIEWSRLLTSLARRMGGPDRFNQCLAAQLVTRLDESILPIMSTEATKISARAVVSYAFGWLSRPRQNAERVRSIVPSLASTILKGKEYPIELKRDAVRLLQIALGDLGPSTDHAATFDGYASRIDLTPFERDLDELRVDLSALFPTGDVVLDRELLRLLAMVTSFNGHLVNAICEQLTEESDPVDDIHRLAVLSRFPMTHTFKQRDSIVNAFVHLEAKTAKRKLPQDASWSDRVKDIWVAMALADEYLARSLVSHPEFGRPGHTIFLHQTAPEFLPIARAGFARRVAADENYAWTNEVVFALGESSEPAHQLLVRSQFDRFAVRGAILVLFSRSPQPADRDKFIAGLDWSQSEVQAACLEALDKLGPSDNPVEQLALLKSLRRLHGDDKEFALRENVVRLLERNTSQKFPFETGKSGYRPQPEAIAAWTAWCQQKWPAETAAELGDGDGEGTRLTKSLHEVAWSSGDAQRGALLFGKRACIQCHSGRGSLGPDLSGATQRFSKEDLFIAIAIPSRDVSSRYQTTIVQTKDGKTYSGLVIYESVDGFILRNGTGQTFRIETDRVEEKKKSPVSLMPTGLLKDLTSQDYADLYAFLQTLDGSKATPTAQRIE